jgi:DNA primase
MVNSNLSSTGGCRKEEKHECIDYVSQITSKLDIAEVSRGFGLKMNDEGWAICPNNHDKNSTLKIDKANGSFRCYSPECNDHSDIITLTQRLLDVKFEDAAKIFSNGSGFGNWINEFPDRAAVYGRMRECMAATAKFYASQISSSAAYLESRGISLETAQKFTWTSSGNVLRSNHMPS